MVYHPREDDFPMLKNAYSHEYRAGLLYQCLGIVSFSKYFPFTLDIFSFDDVLTSRYH